MAATMTTAKAKATTTAASPNTSTMAAQSTNHEDGGGAAGGGGRDGVRADVIAGAGDVADVTVNSNGGLQVAKVTHSMHVCQCSYYTWT